ncbi:MAG: ABC-F family ATP-binding cassette domain-containing protein [Tepidisphaeraceae bacterium]|jgi:ATP-binding cassette subfamily F protein 3
MALATLLNIEKNFGRRVMFDQLGFSIDRGERVGLIGDNGSGKTTLFRVLTRQLAVDAGTVSIADGVKFGMLAQDPVFEPGNTVMDEAELAFSTLHDLSHRLREIEHEMAHVVGDELEKLLNKYQDAQHDFELAGGYAWRHKLEAMLEGVGLPPATWEQNVGTLSGGQRSRLALAKLLIGQCDLLLLDEPTNHLDLTAIAWLEEYLASFPGAVLLVSHDRYLLDRLATRIVWLTGAQLKSYPGNYSAYVEQRKLQELSQQRAYEQQQADIAKQAEFIRRFGAGQRAREAKGREKRLNRLLAGDDLIQSVETASKIRVSMNSDLRAGDRVLRVKELSKRYGDRALWTDVALDISRGERIGIIGPNGSGKTTLLEVLLGKRELDAGEIRWGASLKIGYYDQRLGEFNPDHTVAEEVRSGRDVTDADVRAVLALMLFRNEDIEKPIRMLSGGERARVAIAQLLIDRPNVLVMDEPTNHLDINSCEALERALNDFDGTVICVSHDRYFLDKVAQRMLVLEPPEIVSFDGNYTAWAQAGAKKKAAAGEAQAAQSSKKSKPSKKKPESPPREKSDNPWSRPYGRLSVEELEKQIALTETEIRRCQESMGDSRIAREPQRGRKIALEHEELTKKLKELEKEYFARSV